MHLNRRIVLELMVGSELSIARFYAEKHNMSTKMVVDEIEQWGGINDNWTGVGILGNIAMDNADVGLGKK